VPKPRFGLVLNAQFDQNGPVVFEYACLLGCEGIVSKRKNSRYSSGRCRDWLKTENPAAPAVKRRRCMPLHGQPGDRAGTMRGTLLVFQPHALPHVREFLQPPSQEEVQAVVGGDLQAVPGFRSIRYGNMVMDCIALCDANGNLENLAINNLATIAWKEALRRAVDAGLWRSELMPTGPLVGTVAVLFGDREFMDAL